MHSRKQNARRRARTAQLAAGVGFAGTLAIAVLPLHAALTRRAEPIDTAGPTDVQPTDRPAPESLDKAWASNIFEQVGPAAIPASTPTDQSSTQVTETAPVDPEPRPGDDGPLTPNTRWQYLGSIATSRGRSALLRDTLNANQQHLVAEGKEVEGFTVRSVTAAHVILADPNGQTQVDLAPVSSSWSAPAAPAPVRAAAGIPAGQQRGNSRINPAMANRTRAGRTTKEIDPEVARQLREELFQGNMDLDRLSALQKAGVIDDATAEELVIQYKEVQNLSEEEYAEIRGKLRQ